jgi:hypothetical protein
MPYRSGVPAPERLCYTAPLSAFLWYNLWLKTLFIFLTNFWHKCVICCQPISPSTHLSPPVSGLTPQYTN